MKRNERRQYDGGGDGNSSGSVETAERIMTYKLLNEKITPHYSEGNVSDLTKSKNDWKLSKLN